MRNNKNNFVFGKFPDQPTNLFHAVIIQARGRFIEYKHFFSAYHANCYSYTLLLPS